jgi:hypothetical protein
MDEKKITIKNDPKEGMNKLLNPVRPVRIKPELEEILKEIEEIQKEEEGVVGEIESD